MTERAYLSGIAAGADGLECDLRLSADLDPVLVHDADLLRTLGKPIRIATTSTDELRAAGLLTLQEWLALVDGRVSLSIEIKHPIRPAGLLEQITSDLLKGYTGEYVLMSFNILALERLASLLPHVPRVYLTDTDPGLELPAGASIVGPKLDVLQRDSTFVRRMHDHGNAVHVWTVDDAADMTFCAELGVDAIITNEPALAVRTLG